MQTGYVNTAGMPGPPSPIKAAEKAKRKPAADAWGAVVSDTAAISGDAAQGAQGELTVQADGAQKQSAIVDVEAFIAAIRAFVEAYNRWIADRADAAEMRAALYRPVELPQNGAAVGSISLYEIGVSHTADYTKKNRLTVRESVLRAALEKRGGDVAVLFTKNGDGLLDRLNAIVGQRDSADSPQEKMLHETSLYETSLHEALPHEALPHETLLREVLPHETLLREVLPHEAFIAQCARCAAVLGAPNKKSPERAGT